MQTDESKKHVHVCDFKKEPILWSYLSIYYVFT